MSPTPPDKPVFPLSQTVSAHRAADSEALAAIFARLQATDPAFCFAVAAKDSKFRLLGSTPADLARRLAEVTAAATFAVDADPPDVSTCWTPGRVAEAEHRLGSADGGAGDFAVVRLRIVPRRSGEGNLFESEFAGPPEIDAFNAAVARGVAIVWAEGVKGEGQIIDTRVVFIDGAFHSTRSTPASFERAGAAAMRSACAGAAMRRLEPLVEVELQLGRDDVRPVVNDLAACGGSEVRRQLMPSGILVVAELPMRLLDYEARLGAVTGTCGKILGEPRRARLRSAAPEHGNQAVRNARRACVRAGATG